MGRYPYREEKRKAPSGLLLTISIGLHRANHQWW